MKKNKVNVLVFILTIVLMIPLLTGFVSRNTVLPQGPINAEDADKGIAQIMQAGVKDKNFATIIYDTFSKDQYFGNEDQNVREILSGYGGKIMAVNSGIKSIEGIEWLRGVYSINLSNIHFFPNPQNKNMISDFTPLSIEHLMKVGNVTYEEAMKWFKPINRPIEGTKYNLEIDISGNPITKYAVMGGDLHVICSGDVPIIETDDLYAIKKDGNAKWNVSKDILLPKLICDGKEIYFDDIKTKPNTANKDIDTEVQERNLKINNIKHSGYMEPWIGIESIDKWIKYYKYGRMSGPNIETSNMDGISFTYASWFNSHIYMPVYVDKSIKTNVDVTKTTTGDATGEPIENAKYQLYYANQNKLVSNEIYSTDENGQFSLTALAEGSYHLKEIEAPKGYELNQKNIRFKVGRDESKITITGGENNFKINAGEIQKEEDTVYIDRYSNDISIDITSDSNSQLEYIEVTYFDYDTQQYQTITGSEGNQFKDGREVSEWINQNKGNEQTMGKIDGEVKVKAQYLRNQEVWTTNEVENKEIPTTEIETGDQKTTTGLIIISVLAVVIGIIACVRIKKIK